MNKVMIALLAGFAAGILLAPDKGSVTRKKLSDGFDDLANKLSDLADKISPEQNEGATAGSAFPKMGTAL